MPERMLRDVKLNISETGESKEINAEGRTKETDRGMKGGERKGKGRTKTEIDLRTKGRKRKERRKKEMKR
jgi:hypothetical protein